MKVKSIMVVLTAAVLLLSAGCSSNASGKFDPSLKIGLMPAVDAAPVYIAEEKGYFKQLGLDVELELFNNAQNRQSALQAGTIDGTMTDLIAAAVNAAGGFELKATTMTDGVFPVLMKKGSESKKNVKVGMMEVSVTNFLIDEWLGGSYEIEKVYINDIPARLAAIGSGQLDMGLFPEPVASMGAMQGLEKKLYKPKEGYCPDVIIFTGKAIKEKSQAVKLFHQAYNRAVEEINGNPELARDILMKKIPNLKPEVRDMMELPTYSKASLPDDGYIEKIIEWTSGVVKKKLDVKPGDLVERKFVSK